ncbi:MAG TPA: UDP-N-acetylglucosamine 2-epimerase (non-hydrolyzing) [Caldisericia bacterium]|nr:UDP-N-acetylglucosamine 2-epimerase (non-hydrolyzing) [Caldisericia bacterium]HPF48246.1 UDP-N-acetylglucosamine 2-epimerase (non-hydrolyzing) [Caldisericia bacterium]HPI83818.1 UDP-N-acetylglucosamine 2-epimerase (non-hydrolyzing) [Caldisericia bacterium]HPQ92699.1 UDP-N-acetylglucosamine 2-epimerase (non-hydrolyzing) [Caldisericia bacterium]HRV74203.1 UDP-N-acetylglucosamine 2-epimerase (non-hydrolyzing) [Caldisericia bacterium]
MKVFTIFGTRPEAIKMAPLVKVFQEDKRFDVKVAVTAQHREMLDQVLNLFSINPDFDLNIMKKKQTLGDITTRALKGLEDILSKEKPDVVLVHGDTTTTFAGALASFYQSPPIACGHVEAGLRSYSMTNPYPEEANRVLTDHLCKYHFAPTESSRQNLLKEGIDPARIVVTGNTVVDALHRIQHINKNVPLPVEKKKDEKLITVTMHRRESWGKPLENICMTILRLHSKYPETRFVFPWHLNPKVREIIAPILSGLERIHLIEPLGYSDFINLLSSSYLVMSDSGGIQEEAASLRVPVLLLRSVTERPEALDCGICKLVGTNEEVVYEEASKLLSDKNARDSMIPEVNPFGDGKASVRIRDFLAREWGI